jgi:hypothetical protein
MSNPVPACTAAEAGSAPTTSLRPVSAKHLGGYVSASLKQKSKEEDRTLALPWFLVKYGPPTVSFDNKRAKTKHFALRNIAALKYSLGLAEVAKKRFEKL